MHTSIVLSGRLMPTKVEPPKIGGGSELGNPNDGSSTSDLKSSSSGRTQLTSVQVPRLVSECLNARLLFNVVLQKT